MPGPLEVLLSPCRHIPICPSYGLLTADLGRAEGCDRERAPAHRRRPERGRALHRPLKALKNNLRHVNTHQFDQYDLWFLQLAILAFFVIAALLSLRSTKAPPHERLALVLYMVEICVVTPSTRGSRSHQLVAMYFVSVNSRSPSCAPSRPMPDCFTPPNGAAGSDTIPRLRPTMPASRASLTRRPRLRSLV